MRIAPDSPPIGGFFLLMRTVQKHDNPLLSYYRTVRWIIPCMDLVETVRFDQGLSCT